MSNELLSMILSLSIPEQEKYFLSLDNAQRDYVASLMQQKARPPATCDLFDGKASFTEWITSHFYVPELNGPIWLAPYQIAALDEATKLDDNGLYAYSLIAWMDIKKSIKSCIAAAVALRMAFKIEWGSIKVVANKKEQAQSRSYFYITRSLKLNPQTAKMLEDGLIKINNYTINFFFNNASIKALPLNPEGEAGGNDDLIIWTEAWAAKTKAAQTMYTEMVIPPNKFGKGFKWIESYAGFSGESPILEPIYENNVKDEYKIDNTDMYTNGRTFALCNHNPQLPWQTTEYYIQQSKELIDSEFKRVHKNMWQSATEQFIDEVAIDLTQTKLPKLAKKEKLIIAVDAAYGINGDCFAVVGITKHPTDKTKKVAQRIARIWRASNKKQLQFKNAIKPEDDTYPYGCLLKLTKQYNVTCIVYDPYQLHSMASEMSQKRIAWLKEFKQGKPREQADNDLYKLIRDKEITIQNDLVIEHLKNANRNSKGRLVKRNQEKKIDLAVALSMAAFVAISGEVRL